ncbi:hypothetical protein Tco_0575466 [Tanacetum coccineum]
MDFFRPSLCDGPPSSSRVHSILVVLETNVEDIVEILGIVGFVEIVVIVEIVEKITVEFNIASRHKNYTLFCEIKHDGTFLDRDIGQVRIIILSHTISLGENVTDMKTIEPVNLGQSAMGVIKEMATEVAKEAKDALLSAMEASFRD